MLMIDGQLDREFDRVRGLRLQRPFIVIDIE